MRSSAQTQLADRTMPPEPNVKARVKLRANAQVTLPEEIRQALHIGAGDEIEFVAHLDGVITRRGVAHASRLGACGVRAEAGAFRMFDGTAPTAALSTAAFMARTAWVCRILSA